MGCGGDSEEYKSAMQRAANAYQFFLQKQSQDPVFMRMQEPKFIREHYMLARMQYKIAGGCGKVDIDSVMSFKEARKKFIMEQPEFEALGNVINMTPTDFIRSQRPQAARLQIHTKGFHMDYMMHSKVYAEAYAKAEISNFSLSGGGVSVESTSVTTETKVKTSSYAEGKITKTITSEQIYALRTDGFSDQTQPVSLGPNAPNYKAVIFDVSLNVGFVDPESQLTKELIVSHLYKLDVARDHFVECAEVFGPQQPILGKILVTTEPSYSREALLNSVETLTDYELLMQLRSNIAHAQLVIQPVFKLSGSNEILRNPDLALNYYSTDLNAVPLASNLGLPVPPIFG